jgi:cytochrome c1
MGLLSFRNLSQEGGPGFTDAQVKQIAAEYQITDGPDDSGSFFERPGVPSDRFKSPFANEEEARASNGGAYPVDFSVLAKARHDGPNYISSLLQGYVDAPADKEVPAGQYYNKYFAGNLIAMAPPLSDEQVEYTDGTPMTVEQYSEDIAAFLMWAAEPKLEERKKMGLRVMIFLTFFAGLLYFSYRKIWADIKH